MITGSIHSTIPSLSNSQLIYRAQLDNKLADKSSHSSPAQLPSVEPPDDNDTDKKINIDADKLQEDAQAKRDASRQAAVHVAGLQQKQNIFDIYINASSDGDENKSSNSASVDPAKIYNESMTYLRRQDLLAAFEQTAKGEGVSKKINVIV